MKRVLMVFFIICLVLIVNRVSAISNPSAVYCESLGYEYEISSTENGDIGICVISPNIKLDAWEFFEGKIGQQYSYCAMNGYITQTLDDGKNSFSEEYAACASAEESVSDLMNLSEKLVSDKFPSEQKPKFSFFQSFINKITAAIVGTFTGKAVGGFTAELPLEFDWRNHNGNWLTPVKNQGSCGSCWAFSTIGNLESKVKIAKNESDFDMDLSEQDMVSCGVPYGFYPGGGGCIGATLEDPLAYLNSSGVVDEACFPYTADDVPCSLCSSSGKRAWKLDSYDYTPLTREDIKNYLVAKGPIIAGIYMGGSFVNGVYSCSNPGSNLNHAVLIVGYNETGRYWIVKNSWGSNWNGNGYFYVGYGKCNIETYTMFTELSVDSTEKKEINDSEAVLGSKEGSYSFLSSRDNQSAVYREVCNSSCTGYDVRDIFSFRNPGEAASIALVAYQNSSNEEETSLYYWNEQAYSWENLGGIPETSYLIRYNLCSSTAECSDYFSGENISLRYSHLSLQNSSVDFSSVDLLYLETNVIGCNDSWLLNETWSSCYGNDMQYKNYYDVNQCYRNISYLNMNVSQQCDYCTPNIRQINESCQTNDSFFSWYNDSNSCFSKTGLESDRIPGNETLPCDYCLANWTENRVCNLDNSSTIWYNDSNSCFFRTGLASDLNGKPANQTTSSCNSSNPINNSSNSSNDTPINNSTVVEPVAATSGGGSSGGGGGGGGGSRIVSSKATETSSADNTNSNSQGGQDNSLANGPESVNTEESNSKKEQPFSLTGLITAVQNNQYLEILLLVVIVAGVAVLVFIIKKNKFSTRNIHRSIVKIHRKKN